MGKEMRRRRRDTSSRNASKATSPTISMISSRMLLVDRPVADEGVGGVGAPPVEVEAALAPVAALPLPQDVGDVLVVVDLARSRRRGSCQQTSGFQSMKRSSRATRRLVQGAAGAAGEAGAVEEDAGVVDEAGDPLACRRCVWIGPPSSARPRP